MKKHILLLVVDDNPADYNLIKRMAEKGLRHVRRVKCSHADSAEACLNAVETQKFDCIFLDYQLGADNGLEILQKLKSKHPNIPVMMLTGEGDETVAVTAMKMGAADYIVKENATIENISMALGGAIEKQELYAKLRDKQTEMEHFAYTAAHDIKSPLAVINQNSQLIAQRAVELQDKLLIEWSQSLVDVSKGVGQFVTALLDYAKVGRSAQKFETIDLKDIIRKVERNLSVIIKDTGATINVSDKLPKIKGDPVAFLQFFQNVLANGLKFRKPNVPPELNVYCRELDETESQFDYKICITDNGMGIDSADHKSIFSPLVRIQRTASVEGAGLGLSIAKKIAEQHKAEIWVESALNEGTTICLLVHSDPEAVDP